MLAQLLLGYNCGNPLIRRQILGKNMFNKGTSFGVPERIESIAYSTFGRLLPIRELHHATA